MAGDSEAGENLSVPCSPVKQTMGTRWTDAMREQEGFVETATRKKDAVRKEKTKKRRQSQELYAWSPA